VKADKVERLLATLAALSLVRPMEQGTMLFYPEF
jgi:hypothetical protein